MPKCIDYTGVKGSHSANKKTKFWIQQRSKVATEGPLVWEHRTVRCTRGLQLELATFGNFQRHSRYNSPDCPVYTGQCPVLQGRAASGTRQLRETPTASPLKFTGHVRCAPDCPVQLRSNDYSAPTATCDAINARAARAEVRHAHAGAPDTLQYMSGAPPDIQAGPEVRTPTVDFQRHL